MHRAQVALALTLATGAAACTETELLAQAAGTERACDGPREVVLTLGSGSNLLDLVPRSEGFGIFLRSDQTLTLAELGLDARLEFGPAPLDPGRFNDLEGLWLEDGGYQLTFMRRLDAQARVFSARIDPAPMRGVVDLTQAVDATENRGYETPKIAAAEGAPPWLAWRVARAIGVGRLVDGRATDIALLETDAIPTPLAIVPAAATAWVLVDEGENIRLEQFGSGAHLQTQRFGEADHAAFIDGNPPLLALAADGELELVRLQADFTREATVTRITTGPIRELQLDQHGTDPPVLAWQLEAGDVELFFVGASPMPLGAANLRAESDVALEAVAGGAVVGFEVDNPSRVVTQRVCR
ncbi:MAG: hypothetical protein AAGF12_06125 [Myxococcota bacterium]